MQGAFLIPMLGQLRALIEGRILWPYGTTISQMVKVVMLSSRSYVQNSRMVGVCLLAYCNYCFHYYKTQIYDYRPPLELAKILACYNFLCGAWRRNQICSVL